MKNPIIGFCRVKDVVYNQFERPDDWRGGDGYLRGSIYRNYYDTDKEYRDAYKQDCDCHKRKEAQHYYDVNYEKVSPYFGKVVPLSYDGYEYLIQPDGVSDTYNAQYEGIGIPLQWVELLTISQAFNQDIDELPCIDMLEEPGIMFSKTSPVHISISEDSICGVHYVEKIQDGKVVDYGFISKSDLREIYGNIGAILGVKK